MTEIMQYSLKNGIVINYSEMDNDFIINSIKIIKENYTDKNSDIIAEYSEVYSNLIREVERRIC